MITVEKVGNVIDVTNPINGKTRRMVDITFSEEGRPGANSALSESSDLLNQVVGEETGLPNIRVHTQPVLEEVAGKFKVGQKLDLHITRIMHSEPVMQQQVGQPARIIDGKRTYFSTKLSKTMDADVDLRVQNEETIARINPIGYGNVLLRAAEVKLVNKTSVDEAINA